MSGRTYPCCDCCLVKGQQHTIPCPICHPASANALRAELAHMREARDSARAEVERLTTAVRWVRELHRESRNSMSALYPNPICECGKDYPCSTIRALGGE